MLIIFAGPVHCRIRFWIFATDDTRKETGLASATTDSTGPSDSVAQNQLIADYERNILPCKIHTRRISELAVGKEYLANVFVWALCLHGSMCFLMWRIVLTHAGQQFSLWYTIEASARAQHVPIPTCFSPDQAILVQLTEAPLQTQQVWFCPVRIVYTIIYVWIKISRLYCSILTGRPRK